MAVDYKKITLSDGPVEIEIDGQKIPVAYKAGGMNSLIVLFHGALNRKTRPFPFFQPFLPINAHQIAIADVTLAEHDDLSVGWYIGSENSGLPEKIKMLIDGLVKHLGASRRVYVGGSSGGFAALHFSFLDAGSIAVAANPQTDLLAYGSASAEAFREKCWPSAKSLHELADIAPINMCKFYSKGFRNRVIYVQSAGDYGHVQSQLTPFMAAIDANHRRSVLFDVGFWDILGHSGSAPPRAWIPWVRTALTAPTFQADALLKTHYALTEQNIARAQARPSQKQDTAKPDARDLQRAKQLRDSMLNS
ncbi:hypothetical protein OS189_03755 [Sulfitobacter sp. F26169L]|uniref:hypothetical protein n=1 Tax=Sulfitobacter sp. F26169L TaxID=2996015 RepID=UPI002260C07D|nr:hypothetical protein [Sulfitobacter sp. F26169L]MCX7565459.1 hypothetical protein [Sulfitobacter sp. F26169L]